MKNQKTTFKKVLGILALTCAAFTFNAQDANRVKPKLQSPAAITFSSASEKEESIKKLEARYSINLNDPTYPKDLLAKEKKQLDQTRKAKVINSKNK